MPNKNSIQTSKKESGFSLLEVLISILILSFGILGMVGLQASSLQISREARLQASAVRFAEEMAGGAGTVSAHWPGAAGGDADQGFG